MIEKKFSKKGLIGQFNKIFFSKFHCYFGSHLPFLQNQLKLKIIVAANISKLLNFYLEITLLVRIVFRALGCLIFLLPKTEPTSFGRSANRGLVLRKNLLIFHLMAFALISLALEAKAQQTLPSINIGSAKKRYHNKSFLQSGIGRGNSAKDTKLGRASTTNTLITSSLAQPNLSSDNSYIPFSRSVPANIPAVVVTRTRDEIATTTNVMTSAEAFKYLPSVMIRERYIGDNNALVTLRTNAPTDSANTLVYSNGVLLSNLLGNSFNYAPRWGFISPEEIDRVDVIYGPFSALYPGNSVSGVINMHTRMPDQREVHIRGLGSAQQWSLYNHSSVPLTGNINVFYGDRINDFRYILAYNHLATDSQPIWYTGNQINPGGSATIPFLGGYLDYNMYGVPRVITGSTSKNSQSQDLAKIRLSYDLTALDRIEYMGGFWSQSQDTSVQSWITTVNGTPIYNTQSTSGTSALKLGQFTSYPGSNYPTHTGAQHALNALTLKRDSNDIFDYDITLTSYNYLRNFSNSATQYGLLPSTAVNSQGIPNNYTINPTGQNSMLDGSYWRTGDMRFIYRPIQDIKGKHEISFGTHNDEYSFNQAAKYTAYWPSNYGIGSYNFSRGKTNLNSIYIQDAWALNQNWKVIAGARDDYWSAYNGFAAKGGITSGYQAAYNPTTSGFPLTGMNTINATGTAYNNFSKNGFQPKASLEYQIEDKFNLRGSFGRAYRMPTVTEMFLSTSSTGNSISGNSNLRPQTSSAYDLTAKYRMINLFNGSIGVLEPRISFFLEDRWNAIYTQNTLNNFGVDTTFQTNIGKVNFKGIETEITSKDILIKGLDYSGSVTFTDAHIVSNNQQSDSNIIYNPPCWPGSCYAWGSLIAGNQYPRIPRFRIRSVITYTPNKDLSLAIGTRYASAAYVTLANNDFNRNNYGNVDSAYLFFDMKANYKFEKNWTATFGIDNIGRYKAYVDPNPYPQRTFFAGIKYDFGDSDDVKLSDTNLTNSATYSPSGGANLLGNYSSVSQ